MEYEWDEVKRLANLQKHKVDFYAVYDFDWDTALIKPSEGYGEARLTGIGYLKDRLYYVVYAIRGKKRRIISLRTAKSKERNDYARH